MYPKINALIVRKGIQEKAHVLPVEMRSEHRRGQVVVLDNEAEGSRDRPSSCGHELRLRETFWDKQIVDISGSKVVRVNDLHILKDGIKLWLVHVDVGFKGILRRLGWLGFFSSAVRWLFAYELKDKFIQWKYVQPVTTADYLKSLSLKVPLSKLSQLHPADLADILVDLGAEERLLIFSSFDDNTASDILQELPLKMRLLIAKSLEHRETGAYTRRNPDGRGGRPHRRTAPRYRVAVLALLPEEKVGQVGTCQDTPTGSPAAS